MFREISAVKQNPDEPPRRWFQGSTMDLFIWGHSEHQILRFQLSYDKPSAEKALTWDINEGFSHDRIDDGTRPGHHPGAPILLHDPNVDTESLAVEFGKHAAQIDNSISAFIVSKIREYPEYLEKLRSMKSVPETTAWSTISVAVLLITIMVVLVLLLVWTIRLGT